MMPPFAGELGGLLAVGLVLAGWTWLRLRRQHQADRPTATQPTPTEPFPTPWPGPPTGGPR